MKYENEFERMEIKKAEEEAAIEKVWQKYLALPEEERESFGDQG
jgi:hypothetical protein